jgi:hypothetical protein
LTLERGGVDAVAAVAEIKNLHRSLGRHGLALWNRIHSETVIDDAASIEILCLAAATLDRAEGLSARIKGDGEVIQTRAGLKAHPAIREETACRGLVARLLARLGPA